MGRGLKQRHLANCADYDTQCSNLLQSLHPTKPLDTDSAETIAQSNSHRLCSATAPVGRDHTPHLCRSHCDLGTCAPEPFKSTIQSRAIGSAILDDGYASASSASAEESVRPALRCAPHSGTGIDINFEVSVSREAGLAASFESCHHSEYHMHPSLMVNQQSREHRAEHAAQPTVTIPHSILPGDTVSFTSADASHPYLRSLLLPDVVRAHGGHLMSFADLECSRARSYSAPEPSVAAKRHKRSASMPEHVLPSPSPLKRIDRTATMYRLHTGQSRLGIIPDEDDESVGDWETVYTEGSARTDAPQWTVSSKTKKLSRRASMHHDYLERSDDKYRDGSNLDIEEAQPSSSVEAREAGLGGHFRSFRNSGTASEPLRMIFSSRPIYAESPSGSSHMTGIKGKDDQQVEEDIVIESWTVDEGQHEHEHDHEHRHEHRPLYHPMSSFHVPRPQDLRYGEVLFGEDSDLENGASSKLPIPTNIPFFIRLSTSGMLAMAQEDYHIEDNEETDEWEDIEEDEGDENEDVEVLRTPIFEKWNNEDVQERRYSARENDEDAWETDDDQNEQKVEEEESAKLRQSNSPNAIPSREGCGSNYDSYSALNVMPMNLTMPMSQPLPPPLPLPMPIPKGLRTLPLSVLLANEHLHYEEEMAVCRGHTHRACDHSHQREDHGSDDNAEKEDVVETVEEDGFPESEHSYESYCEEHEHDDDTDDDDEIDYYEEDELDFEAAMAAAEARESCFPIGYIVDPFANLIRKVHNWEEDIHYPISQLFQDSHDDGEVGIDDVDQDEKRPHQQQQQHEKFWVTETLVEHGGRVFRAENPATVTTAPDSPSFPSSSSLRFVHGCRPRSAKDRKNGCWKRLKEVT